MAFSASTVGLRGFIGIDPETGKFTEIGAEADFYHKVIKGAPSWAFTALKLVFEIVDRPSVIFHDLKRENFADAWAYCGKPASAQRPGVLVAFIGKRSGLGFASPFLVFGMEWRREDPEMAGYPLNFKEDFGGEEIRWKALNP